jgi:heat shock transcription factor 1
MAAMTPLIVDGKEDLAEEKDSVLPAFLSKTFEIFSRADFASICGWNAAGDTIIIHDPDVFVKQVLPRFFKHRNLPSFVRQLNMYGFHKSVLDSNKREFRHKMFLRDKPQLLHLIKRKVNVTASPANATEKQRHDLWSEEILNEMKQLKTRSEIVEKRLRDVEIDNAIVRSDNIKLWKQLEVAKDKQMIMQEKMKKILWILFQIYRGKNSQMPKLSSEKAAQQFLTDE